jgi:beta-N-acetylhexosaminidase
LLKRLGVNVDLAPVVDVGRPHSALRREQRTFSGDAATVAAIGDAFAAGLGDAGVAATFKHFPGLGAARHDTDAIQTVIPLPRATLRAVDERPFAMASRPGPRLVMVSLAVYPALDSVPAALSPAVVNGELRHVARFGGVSVTDSLDTPATARYGSSQDLALRAVRAGVDLVLFGRSYRGAAKAADAVQVALRRGTLNRAQLLAGSERVLRLRGQLAP